MNEWFVSAGKHEGLICGADWVKAQSLLAVNSSKSYRKPRSNTALLSGLLHCAGCGDYMRPKLSDRFNENGEQIFSYLCNTKEKSRSHNCAIKNPNGNTLDWAVCEEIKKLGADSSEFIKQLEAAKSRFVGNREEYVVNIEKVRWELKENEKKIGALVETSAMAGDSAANVYIIKQIEALHGANEILRKKIEELKGLTQTGSLTDDEFDILSDSLSNFEHYFLCLWAIKTVDTASDCFRLNDRRLFP